MAATSAQARRAAMVCRQVADKSSREPPNQGAKDDSPRNTWPGGEAAEFVPRETRDFASGGKSLTCGGLLPPPASLPRNFLTTYDKFVSRLSRADPPRRRKC